MSERVIRPHAFIIIILSVQTLLELTELARVPRVPQ